MQRDPLVVSDVGIKSDPSRAFKELKNLGAGMFSATLGFAGDVESGLKKFINYLTDKSSPKVARSELEQFTGTTYPEPTIYAPTTEDIGGMLSNVTEFDPRSVEFEAGSFFPTDPSKIAYPLIGISSVVAANKIAKRMRPNQSTLGMLVGGIGDVSPSKKNALEKAKELESQNLPREKVFYETGWFRGKDGKWRTEISDKESSYLMTKDNFFNNLEEVPIEYKIKNDANDVPLKVSGKVQVGELDEIFEHDELFRIYPQLRGLDITIVPDNVMDRFAGRAHGYYYRGNRFGNQLKGVLSARKPEEMYGDNPRIVIREGADMRSTILHELQHAIQDIEGMASGGNPEMAHSLALKATQKDVEKKSIKLRDLNKKLNNPLDKQKTIESILYNASDMKRLADFMDVKQPRHLFNTIDWNQYGDIVTARIGYPPRYGERSSYANKAGKELARVIFQVEYDPDVFRFDTENYADVLINRERNRNRSKPVKTLYNVTDGYPIYSFSDLLNHIRNDSKEINRVYKNANATSKRLDKKLRDNNMYQLRQELAQGRADVVAIKDSAMSPFLMSGVKSYRTAKNDGSLEDFLESTDSRDLRRYGLYQRILGESDAFTTEKRRNLSATERMNKPFFEDYIVPENQMFFDE